MKEPLNIIGIITARGGSVRLPLKNIKPLGGKPLIAYMIAAARQSKYLKRVIVSTDHPEIKKVSLRYKAEVPFKRPKRISGNCASLPVIQHAVRFIEKQEKRRVDIAVTLQPTNPFCRAEDIDLCIEMLLKSKTAHSVFSAVEVHRRPEWMFRLKRKNRAELYIPGSIKGKRAVKNFFDRLISPNGGISATKREVLFNEGAIISRKALAYVMPQERSIDIDYEADLKIAEVLLTKAPVKKLRG